MKKRLNKNTRKKQTLAFIGKYIEDNGYSPTYSEMAEKFGISTQQIINVVNDLEKDGAVKKTSDQIRRLEVVK